VLKCRMLLRPSTARSSLERPPDTRVVGFQHSIGEGFSKKASATAEVDGEVDSQRKGMRLYRDLCSRGGEVCQGWSCGRARRPAAVGEV